MKKTNKIKGHWDNGFFMVDKPVRPFGRLAQLNKQLRKRHDSDAVIAFKLAEEHAPQRG